MKPNRSSRGIQSVEAGGALLQALARTGRPLPLKELAAAANMTPAKAHPYLVSYARLGLVQQADEGGPYGLGPLAVTLGLISLQHVDPIRLASERLEPLAIATEATTALAVWSAAGPTIVRVATAPKPVFVSLRLGTVLDLAHTATGRVFAAYSASPDVNALWLAQGGVDSADWHQQLQAVRNQGYAVSDESLVPGVAAIAAPVCNALGHIQLALVALAPCAQWPAGQMDRVAAALKQEAAGLQRLLG